MNTRGRNWRNNTGMIQLSTLALAQGSPLLMPQRLMFSLGAINNFLFPLPRKVHLHGLSQRLPSYLLLRPFNLTWANLSCSIKRGNRIPQEHRRLCFALCHPPTLHPHPCALTHWAWEQRESHPHHMNQALWQGSVGSGITRRITSLSFYCSPLPSLLAGDERGEMAL